MALSALPTALQTCARIAAVLRQLLRAVRCISAVAAGCRHTSRCAAGRGTTSSSSEKKKQSRRPRDHRHRDYHRIAAAWDHPPPAGAGPLQYSCTIQVHGCTGTRRARGARALLHFLRLEKEEERDRALDHCGHSAQGSRPTYAAYVEGSPRVGSSSRRAMNAAATLLVSALVAAGTIAPRVASAAVPAGLAPPQHLRVEGLSPASQDVVLSEPRPRFGYHHAPLLAPGAFGVTQASYRVTVSARGGEQPLWDSGHVASNASSEIVYGQGSAGSPADLEAFSRYTFCVQWTATDPSLGTSPQACANFETGPMAAADWQGAGWMVSHRIPGDATNRTQFRSPVFTVPTTKKVEFARLYVAAAGCAHVEINGAVPLPDLRGICPWPVQTSSVRYVTHHLTDDDTESPVQHGITLGERNVIGVIAGHVMKAPQFIALLMVKYEGEEAPFFLSTSDGGWVSAASHVLPQSEASAASHATQFFGAWDTTIDWTK
eukprot:COSAG03_NODE_3633_length_1911_cov_1.755519_2_plen_488_part_01